MVTGSRSRLEISYKTVERPKLLPFNASIWTIDALRNLERVLDIFQKLRQQD